MRGIKHKTGISVGRVTVYVGGCGHACAQVGVTIQVGVRPYSIGEVKKCWMQRKDRVRGKGVQGVRGSRVRVVRLRGGLSPPRRRLSKCFTHLHAVNEANHPL